MDESEACLTNTRNAKHMAFSLFAICYSPFTFEGFPMSLFKSAEDRRIERDIKIRQGIRRIGKAIAEQNKFTDEFVRNARRAKEIGDNSQYVFIRNSLKKTATVKKMLERQLLAVKNALIIKRQAEASTDFAEAMGIMAGEISRMFGETDLVKTQTDWEKAMAQSQSMEERMSMFLETVEDIAASDTAETPAEVVTDQEIDAMIEAEAESEHAKDMDELDALRSELNALKEKSEKESK
jgi:cysteinyl-tRNA synthetase